MSSENKILICAGVAGIVGAGVLGYVVGRQRKKHEITPSDHFMVKSHYAINEQNPIMQYVIENSLRQPEVLRKLQERTYSYGIRATMLAAPEELQFFRVLLPLLEAKKVIEIGAYTGYNTLNMAMSLPADGKVICCDITDEHINAVGKSLFKEAGVDHKIDLQIRPASETLDELLANGEAGTFDFVFIDADKVRYDLYYEKSLLLVRKGGIIAIDNVLWDGKVIQEPSQMNEDTKAIHALNQKVHKDSRVNMVMLPFADGVTLATKL